MESPRGRAEGGAPSPDSARGTPRSPYDGGSPHSESGGGSNFAARLAAFNGGANAPATPPSRPKGSAGKPPLPPGSSSSAVHSELEMVRRSRAATAGAGSPSSSCECAQPANAAPSSFGQQQQQQQQQHQHASAGSGPTPTLSMGGGGGGGGHQLADGSSIPTLGIHSPRQAALQDPHDDLGDGQGVSPRVSPSPRPSFVPPLQLGGATLGVPKNIPARDLPPQSPRAEDYLSALKGGGLSEMVRLSPRSPRSHPSSNSQQQQQQQQQQQGASKGSSKGASKGASKGTSSAGASAGAAPGKQRPQVEDDVLQPKGAPKAGGGAGGGKRLPQEEDQSLADAVAQTPSLAQDVGVEGNPYSSRGRPQGSGGVRLGSARNNAPMRADLGDMGLDLSLDGADDGEADDSSFVMATPRTPRLSARNLAAGDEDFKPLNGLMPLNGSSAAANGGGGGHGDVPPIATGAEMASTPRGLIVESPRGPSSAAGELVLTARNVMLTPRGGHRSSDPRGGLLPEPLPVESPRDSSGLPTSFEGDGGLGAAAASPRASGASPPGGFTDDFRSRVEMPPLQLPGSHYPPQQPPQPPKKSKGGGPKGQHLQQQHSHVTEMTRMTFTDDDAEAFEVTVPDGAQPGAVLRLTLPSGELVEIPVPEGAVPGDKLSFELSKSSMQAVEMALSGEQIIFPGKVCRGKKVKKQPPPANDDGTPREKRGGGGPLYEVVVPAGWLPGFHTHFQAQLGEVVAAIPVPDLCEPKTVLHVEAPKGTSKVDVVIPDDVTPGSQFVANVGGQLVNVPCPPHMRPGQTLSVAVAGDAALELGEVRIVKHGKPRAPSNGRGLAGMLGSKSSGGSKSSARRPPQSPSYEMNVGHEYAPSPADSARGSARGHMSPGRHGQQSPGRASSPRHASGAMSPGRANSPGSSRGPRPKRSSSPVSRAAALLGGGRSKK